MINWIPNKICPVQPGTYPGDLYLVEAREYGCPPAYFICTCWKGIREVEHKWYLDRHSYRLDTLINVASPVVRYVKITEVRDDQAPDSQA
jgi:hypothetical protein